MHFKSGDGCRELFAKWGHGVRASWIPHVSAMVSGRCAAMCFGHDVKGPKDKVMKPVKFSAFVRWWKPCVVVFVGGRRAVSWNW